MNTDTESNTYRHPDGTPFESSKELLDYVDTLREDQEAERRESEQKRARFDEMVKDMDEDDHRRTKWHRLHDGMTQI